MLIVEDEPSIRSLFERIVNLEGYQEVSASTGEEALRLLRAGLPASGILLDLKMPGMGGLAFLIQLRAEAHLAGIPVAVVTGDSFLPSPARATLTRLGAEVYFKPIQADELIEVIHRFAARTVAPL